VANITAVGMPASLADRSQLIRMLEVTTRGCVRCILRTVASVCGDDCAKDRLHIRTGRKRLPSVRFALRWPFPSACSDSALGPVSMRAEDLVLKPQRCLEVLAVQLAKGEARAWAQAVEAREPFELSVWRQSGDRVADTYMPTDRVYGGSAVYRGIAGGLVAYACDPTEHGPVWALASATTDENAWQRCEGELWIDEEAGEAYAQLVRGESSLVPLSFGIGLGPCAGHLLMLPFEVPAGSTKAFGDEATPTEIACWLRRFFGPHSSPGWMGSATSLSVEVPSAGFALLADIVVRSGTTLRITGTPAEERPLIVVGESELRVEAGARLDLDGLTIANSTVSSALAVEGAATVARCTFVRCSTTHANLVVGGVAEAAVPDGVRAFLASVGGAAFVAAHGTLQVTASAVLDCSATIGLMGALGGAIYAGSGARLSVVDSELRRNSVEGGGWLNSGGAIFLYVKASATLQGSTLSENVVLGGGELTQGGAAAVFFSATMNVSGTRVSDNLAAGGSISTYGGAFFVMTDALLTVSDSPLSRNTARCKDGDAVGGAIAVYANGRLVATGVEFVENRADASACSRAGGGALFLQGSSTEVQGATFVSNSAFGGSTANLGGAIYAAVIAAGVRLSDAVLRDNVARGYEPYGGAIETKVDIRMANVTMSANRVIATGGQGFGGALHIASSVATLVGCRLHHNVAESLHGAFTALGGSVFAEADATLRLSDSRVWLNAAGGVGSLQGERIIGGYNTGMNIEGTGVFERCDFADTGEGGEAITLDRPSRYWLYPGRRLVIRESSFRSSSLGGALLPCWSDILIHGSTFVNLPIEPCSDPSYAKFERGTLGIVNSTFEPPLASSVVTVQPPDCGMIAAGERVCDQRARCEAAPSGGVRCLCVDRDALLRYKPGVPEDGRQCEQDASLRAVLESESVSVDVAKPGSLANRPLTLVVEAHGETELTVAFHVAMTRREAGSEVVIVANGSIRVDQPSISAFGHHVEWKRKLPPPGTWKADLDANRLKYATTQRHDFTVRLACDRGEQSCAADGDIISTTVQLVSPQDIHLKSHEVTIQTRVVALASCNHSVAAIMQSEGSLKTAVPVKDSLVMDAALVFVDLRVVDADGIPIYVSLPKAVVLWGREEGPRDQVAPTKPAEGGSRSNRLTASIEARLRSMPGTYLLQVVLMDAWNEALGAVGECVLLKQIVRVDGPDEGFNTAYVILGCAIGAAILIILLVFVVRKYKDRFEHIFGTIIVEVFKLTFAWAFEGGDIATDGINFHRTVISNEIRVGYILPQRYKIAYIVIMCLASAAAAVSFVNRVRQTRDLLRSIRERLSKSASASKPDEAYNVEAKVDQLNWEVVKFKRDILGIAVSALTVLCEGRAHASLKMDALPSALSSLAPLHGVCVGMMAPKGTVWVRP
jgi:hypothetical protein